MGRFEQSSAFKTSLPRVFHRVVATIIKARQQKKPRYSKSQLFHLATSSRGATDVGYFLHQLRQVRRPSAFTELVALDLSRGCLSPNPLDRGKTSPTFSSEPRQVIYTELARATIRVLLRWSELKYCLFLAFGRGSVLRIPISRLPSPPESYLYMETTPCEILSSTAPTITGYSLDSNLTNYVSYISEISFHTHPSEDHAVIHGHGPLLRL
ncbi:hypothetical protein Acr_00g0099570 [Actinidia rufa]|uniref:Uncharacterized protein n=1 Tax=Actinidia rufa TaxID=165716 RepID=A0A7J0E087_9ERIC|nr:hypothetical protein Acr_00g0099570 [Actinidia rufa]